MEFLAERDTPTVPTDRHAALASLRRDRVIAIRIYGSGSEIELPSADGERIVIGAAPDSDIALEDPYISAVHCELERRPHDRLLIRDRRSKNGTFLNGNRVEVAELPIGAVLTVGRTGLLALGRRSRQQPSARELPATVDLAVISKNLSRENGARSRSPRNSPSNMRAKRPTAAAVPNNPACPAIPPSAAA